MQATPVLENGRIITEQLVHSHAPHLAFKLTALADRLDDFEQQMFRFLKHTTLQALQWVNLYHQDVSFVTLINDR